MNAALHDLDYPEDLDVDDGDDEQSAKTAVPALDLLDYPSDDEFHENPQDLERSLAEAEGAASALVPAAAGAPPVIE